MAWKIRHMHFKWLQVQNTIQLKLYCKKAASSSNWLCLCGNQAAQEERNTWCGKWETQLALGFLAERPISFTVSLMLLKWARTNKSTQLPLQVREARGWQPKRRRRTWWRPRCPRRPWRARKSHCRKRLTEVWMCRLSTEPGSLRG